jgi:hypothetical protein
MNPPYLNNLHINFLKRYLNLSDYVSTIEPFTFYVDTAPNIRFKDKKLVREIQNRVEYVKIVNPNIIWPDCSFCSLVYIVFFSPKNKQNYIIFNDLFDEMETIKNTEPFGHYTISPHYYNIRDKLKYYSKNTPKNPMMIDFVGKIKNISDFSFGLMASDPFDEQLRGKYIVRLAYVRGHTNMLKQYYDNDYWTFFERDNKILTIEMPEYKKYKPSLKKYRAWVIFDSLQEAKNCKKYLKNKIIRFALMTLKVGQKAMRKTHYVPWFDFKNEITSEKLIDILGLTLEECKFIDKVIPNYYEEDVLFMEPIKKMTWFYPSEGRN